MTRARTRTREFGSQPLSQLLLAAALFACVMIVSNVAAMFGMRKRSKDRDWHTNLEPEALPQTKPDIQFKDLFGPPDSWLAVDAQRRTQTLTQTTNTAKPTKSFSASRRESFFAFVAGQKDARVKPGHGAFGLVARTRQEADLLVRIPREGGHPVLRAAQTHTHTSALARADQTPPARGKRLKGLCA